jgi:hypothetical protein
MVTCLIKPPCHTQVHRSKVEPSNDHLLEGSPLTEGHLVRAVLDKSFGFFIGLSACEPEGQWAPRLMGLSGYNVSLLDKRNYLSRISIRLQFIQNLMGFNEAKLFLCTR